MKRAAHDYYLLVTNGLQNTARPPQIVWRPGSESRRLPAMTDRNEATGMTADGLVVLRASPEAAEIGIHDPYAASFASEAGRKMAQVGSETDRAHKYFNLARFRYTTEALQAAAAKYTQVVILGSGFDTRSLWLPEFASGRVRVFEVDQPGKLEQKRNVLNQLGVRIPDSVTYVPADLAGEELPELLTQAGFQRRQPAFVLIEGVIFYLSQAAARALFDPAWLGLARKSTVVFDYWSDERVNVLNDRVKQRFGVELFRFFPQSHSPEKGLAALGYLDVQIRPLQEIAGGYFKRPIEDEFLNSWFIVTGTM